MTFSRRSFLESTVTAATGMAAASSATFTSDELAAAVAVAKADVW